MTKPSNPHSYPQMHAPLSRAIAQAAEKLLLTLPVEPDESFFEKNYEGTGGSISLADLMAYQIGWGSLLIGWYESGIHGRMPIMPGDGFTSWEYTAIAQHFYQKYHNLTPERLIEEFLRVVGIIIAITETEFLSGDLDNTGVWPWCTLKSGKQWPLSKWIQVNTVAPYKRAVALIKKGLSQ